MELLGPSLWDVWKKTEQSLTPEYAACVAVEALTILEDLHRRGSDTTPFASTPQTCHMTTAHPVGKMRSLQARGPLAWQDDACHAAGLCMGTSSLRTSYWATQTPRRRGGCTLWIWA